MNFSFYAIVFWFINSNLIGTSFTTWMPTWTEVNLNPSSRTRTMFTIERVLV
jgi:hypothetical protein